MPTRKRKKTASRKKTRTRKVASPGRLHDKEFPAETLSYRRARNALLAAEMKLRRQSEAVAAMRRALPAGGLVRTNYVFSAASDSANIGQVRMSELFAPGKNTLVIYSFMFGSMMERPCPSCTSILDALEGNAQHINQRMNLAVVAKSPLSRVLAFARERGWRRLRLLSSINNSYNRDYLAETDDGRQMPMLNVFVKRGDEIRHFWGSEMLYAPWDKGQEPRHVDFMWPLWNIFDMTPDGRGTDWQPKLNY
jgi:predicted dithiol-disulfide oxidoreductase (DUF899 family)